MEKKKEFLKDSLYILDFWKSHPYLDSPNTTRWLLSWINSKNVKRTDMRECKNPKKIYAWSIKIMDKVYIYETPRMFLMTRFNFATSSL